MSFAWTGKSLSKTLLVLCLCSVSMGIAGCVGQQDGVDAVETKTGAITGGWKALTLLDGWANYWGSSYLPSVGIVDGIVTFRGAIKTNGTPASAVPFSFSDPAFAAFRTADDNAVSVPTVMWQPGVGDVIGSFLYKGNILVSGYNAAVYQDPNNTGGDTIVGPGAQFFTSLEGVAYDAAVGTGIPVELNTNWQSEYTRRQNIYGATCSSGNCGVWVKNVNGFIRFQGFLDAIDQSDINDGYMFTLTDSTFIPGQVVSVPVDLGNGTSWGAVTIYPSGQVYVNGNPPAANQGVSFENVWFSKTNSGNVAVPLSHGWTAFSPRQVKVGVYGGVVRFQGAISGGTSGTIATLAAGYRPTSQVRMTAVANGPVPAFVVIDTAGNVTVEGVPLNVAAQYLSLDGLSFAI